MRRLTAQTSVLRNDPPPEFFLASYFIGNDWWLPPDRKQGADALEQPIESDLPEYEP